MRSHPLKWPRRLRIAAAAAVFTLHLVAFGFIVATGAHLIGWNIGPALLASRAGVTAALAPLAVWLVLALLAGRFYCSVYCPFGILQDAIGFVFDLLVAKHRAVRRRAAHSADFVRMPIFIVSIAFLAAGYATGFRFFDPYTNFGAVASATSTPVIFRLWNAIVPSHTFSVPAYTLAVALTGFIPLVILAALVAWKARAFCTLICPVGTLLGLVSRKPAVRISIDGSTCIGCGACERACPVDAIDVSARRVDNAKCVRCLKCLASCPSRAIGLSAGRRKSGAFKNAADAQKALFTRRAFVAGGGSTAFAAVAGGAFAAACGKRETVICPPGARSMEEFARRCTGCQACVVNCPGGVIRPAGWSHPTVRMTYDTGLCEFNCKRCTEICPTGALAQMTIREKQRTRIGRARFYPERCVAVQEHHDCGACAEHCPTGALQMVPDKHGVPVPHLTAELCIGCGSCEHPCPVRPEKAILIEPVPVQETATDPQEYFNAHPPKSDAPKSEGDDWLI